MKKIKAKAIHPLVSTKKENLKMHVVQEHYKLPAKRQLQKLERKVKLNHGIM